MDSADLDVATNPDAQPAGRRADTGTPTPRMEPSHPVVPVDDDEPTRYTGESPAARPGDVTRPSSDFDVATGIRGRSAPPGAQRPPTTTRQVPPRPRTPTRPRALTPPPVDDAEQTRVAPEVRPRARLEDVPITRDTAPMAPPAHIVDHVAPPADHNEEQTDVRDEPPVRASEPGRHRSRTFTASFAPTLDEMDPDGAAIDAPLDMFSMLPAEALNELGRRIALRRFAPGEIIIREGDPGDACYIIVDGEVRVLKNDPLQPDAGAVEVARLGNRAMFGEFALLADRRRHATVQATTHCDLYEIPRQLLRELAASYPDVGPLLETFYRQRLLATLLRTAPFFTPLPEEQRAQLLARFVPIRAESGESIVREGQPAGGLYLIVIGAVEITRRLGKHRSVILATLREGAYFGEMSLLSGEPTSATVVAAGPVELALLPPRDFYEIVSTHPQLWASIRREARTRALENARLLAGETGTV
jgi:CRP-like cAMP-binding protein